MSSHLRAFVTSVRIYDVLLAEHFFADVWVRNSPFLPTCRRYAAGFLKYHPFGQKRLFEGFEKFEKVEGFVGFSAYSFQLLVLIFQHLLLPSVKE
jgi:hypothetical protein